MSPSTRFYRFLALGSHLTLLVWVTLWHFALGSESQYSALFLFLFYVLPLLLPLPGMIKAKPYTHAWANFVVLLYIIHGITVAYAVSDERWYAAIEIVLATLTFCGCSVFARKRGRELGTGLKKLKTVMQEERERFEKG